MNKFAKEYMASKRDGRNPYGSRGGYVRDSRRGDRNMGDGRRDYAGGDYDRDYADYGDESYGDSRRYDRAGGDGVDSARGDMRGRGYRMGGDFYYDRGDSDYMPHYGEYPRDRDYRYYAGGDGQGKTKLKKSDIMKWKTQMQNADGSMGEHFDMHEVRQAAEKVGVKYEGYDEKEFCLAMNMLYSDFCEASRSFISKENEGAFYAKMAKAFLEDEDAPEGSEKLALYYYCIVDSDD
jgi:hypothetical protein